MVSDSISFPTLLSLKIAFHLCMSLNKLNKFLSPLLQLYNNKTLWEFHRNCGNYIHQLGKFETLQTLSLQHLNMDMPYLFSCSLISLNNVFNFQCKGLTYLSYVFDNFWTATNEICYLQISILWLLVSFDPLFHILSLKDILYIWSTINYLK